MKNNQTVYVTTLVTMAAVAITFIVHACILGLKHLDK